MAAERILIVYYSRTGTTRRAAGAIAAELGGDLEEIVDKKKRAGPIGLAVTAVDALSRRSADIAEPAKDVGSYDLVVVGTPVWAGSMCCAVRAYLTRQRERLPDLAFFLTAAQPGMERTFAHMAKLCGKAPVATLALGAREVNRGRQLDKVKMFASQLRERRATGQGD